MEFGNIFPVTCNPSEINQVFMNVLLNAAQAIKGKGIITIGTHKENDNVHIEITDTGVGISPGKIQKIFDPGFTKKGSRIKAGIGLFTSYNIIQKHQGQIKVESEVGKGSTFTIILPRGLKKSSKESDKADSDNPSDRCSKLK